MITDLPTSVPLAEVRRLLGYPSGRALPARVRSRLEALLPEASSLLKPRGVHVRLPLAEAPAVELPLPGPAGALSGFVLALVTIGPGVETRAAETLHAGAASDALLLDAIGSAAAEATADALGSRLAEGDAGGSSGLIRGLRADPDAGPGAPTNGAHGPGRAFARCRISPGYGGWPLTAQEAIFARLPHDAIGVRLLPSMLMVPRKSVTFALWIDARGRVIAGDDGCSRCLLETCPRRVTH